VNKILAFSGSASSKSINQKLVRLACALLEPSQVTVIDIRDYPLPVYSLDIEEGDGIPENAHKLRALFTEHEGFLISSPENNGGMPVILKNVIDWLSRLEGKVFQEKPVLLLSTSPGGRGGMTNLATMKTLMPWWGGKVVKTLSIGNFFDEYAGETSPLNTSQTHEELTACVRTLETEVQS